MRTLDSPRTTLPRKPIQDINHCYWLGNKRLYSASRVITDLGMKPDFTKVDRKKVLDAACVGKLSEGYALDLIQRKPVTIRTRHCGPFYPKVRDRVEAFHRWMEYCKPEFVDAQDIVFSEQHRVAWRRDLRVIISGTLWLIDIKCTSAPAKDWPLQLGCGLSYDEDKANHAAILRLKPGIGKKQCGFSFVDKWSGAQLRDWWRRAVGRWHSNFDFMMLKNELGFDTEAIGLETEDEWE